MRKLFCFLLCALVLTVGWRAHEVEAQGAAATPLQVSVVGAHTLCTVAASTTNYCLASDGLFVSLNGAAYTQIGSAAPVSTVTINGKTGTIFTISATAATPTVLSTATAPAVSVSVQ